MRKKTKIALIILGIISIIGLFFILYHDFHPELEMLLSPKNYRAEFMKRIRSHGPEDALILIALIGMMCAIPGVSNSVVCIFAGVCYGPWIGLAINILGNSLGNVLVSYVIEKFDLSDKVKKMGHIVDSISHFKYHFLGIVVGFMIPVIPSFLVDYTAIQMKFSKSKLLAATVLGVLPTSFIYAFGGDALLSGDRKRLIIVGVGLVVLFLLYVVVHLHKKKVLAEKKQATLINSLGGK